MPHPLILTSLALVLAAAPGQGEGRKRGRGPDTQDPLTLERVARYPPPGARVASHFRFGHDGRYLYFLGLEGEGVARSLFREEVATGARQVIARAPSAGGKGLTAEEILRRERQRIQDQGITQYHLAASADVAVFESGGEVYLARPGQEADRLTDTPSSEIDPQPSPDGTRVAFARDGELYVLDIKTRAESRLTSGARDGLFHGIAEYIAQEEMDRASGFWWSPDGTRLAYTEVDETTIPVYPIVHQGKAAWEVESPRYPFAGGPNARVRLGVVPAGGGETVWVRISDKDEDFYLARVRFDEDGSLLVQVESRDQKSLRLLRADPRTGDVRPLLEDRSDSWINLHDDLRPLRDGRFLWSSESTGFRHLELRARDGSLVRRLTEGDWAVDDLEGVDEIEGLVYFSAAKDGVTERHLYRVALDGGPAARVTTEPGWHKTTCARDGRLFVDVHESAAAPPRAILKDASGRQVRVLDGNSDPEPRSLALRPPELVTLKARDGNVLHGALGTPRRGKAFETALAGHLGSVEVEDQVAGARYLAGLPYVDGKRLGIYGWSYGGYMAARCLLLAPELFRAAVAGAPVADWDGYDTHYTERYMGRPQDNPEGYRASSLLPLASRLSGRLLIVHGMIDENVHFRHTARLMNALNSAQKRYDILIFPDERHLPRGEDDRRYMETRLVDFFDQALK